MRKIKFSTLFVLLVCTSILSAQNKFITEIPPLKGEKWWGGLVALGSQMPFQSTIQLNDLSKNNLNNQIVPLMLSSQGRYVWSDSPFAFQLSGDTLKLYSDDQKPELNAAGNTLREAYLSASARHFPPSGKIPEPVFFSMPQYNTWIELMYNQNQKEIMDYAHNILSNNFPTGVFMVDDNWQKYYGNFEFKPDRFPDPKKMISDLHDMGFKIMLWICPFVSADTPEFRLLEKKGYLIKQKGTTEAAIIRWWNGYSACYDTTNPEAMAYLKQQLKEMQTLYGVDGFKFDAGDVAYMTGAYDFFDQAACVNDFSEKWAELGLDFPYNEYRTSWKMGGKELVQRLGDKDYSWHACQLLIPDMISAGLLGHLYTCPDMIGGGQYGSFLDIDPTKFDQELIVRSCQIHALMPMMQFSVAPWRILSAENRKICSHYAHLHTKMGAYILELAKNASQTGEPIIRHLEYTFPHQGFIDCKDQFMLGDKYLVAPVVTPGTTRKVTLPKGTWRDDQGKTFRGPKVMEIHAPLERLPYYERLK